MPGSHVILFSSPCCDIGVPTSHPAASLVQSNNNSSAPIHNNNYNHNKPRVVVKNFLFLCLIAFSCFLYIFAIRLVMTSHHEGGSMSRDRNRNEYRSSESGFSSLLRGNVDNGNDPSPNSDNSNKKRNPVKYDDDFSLEEIESTHPHRKQQDPGNSPPSTQTATSNSKKNNPLRIAIDNQSNTNKKNNEPKDFLGIDDKLPQGSEEEAVVSKKQLESHLSKADRNKVEEVQPGRSNNADSTPIQSITPVAVIQDIVIPKKSISPTPQGNPISSTEVDLKNGKGMDDSPKEEFIDSSFQDSQEIELVEGDVTIHEPFGIPIPQEKFQDIFHSRDLLLGLAANTDIKNLAIFCGSIRSVNKNASIVLFVNDPIPSDQIKLFAEYNIHTLAYDQSKLYPEFLRTYHPSSLRWIFYDRLLNLQVNNKHYHNLYFYKKFDKMIVLDIRDSMFQTDPFELIRLKHHVHNESSSGSSSGGSVMDGEKGMVQATTTALPTMSPTTPDFFRYKRSKILFFGEDPSSMINMCNWNSGWVRDCFGSTVLDEIGTQPIICSGVSMGVTKYMLRYIEKMSALLEGRGKDDFPTANFPACERNGVDQGLHNVLIYSKKLNPLHVLYHVDFPVVNLQSALDVNPTIVDDQKTHKQSMEMRMLDREQTLYSLVHQYDRNMDFQLSLAKKYVNWVDWNNPMSEWMNSQTCQLFTPLPDIDLFRGMCDLKSTRVLTAASCCDACLSMNTVKGYRSPFEVNRVPENKRDCTGFTYTNGVCYFKSCNLQDVMARVEVYNQYKTNPDSLDDYAKMALIERGAITGFIKLPKT